MTPVTLPLPRGAFRTSSAKDRAFSLIEVVLAVGVVAFAFVAILGLIPAGMGQFRQAIDTSVCAQIAQRVINDAQQADFTTLIDEKNLPLAQNTYAFRLPNIDATRNRPTKCIRYFDEQGNEIIPSNTTTNQFGATQAERALRDKVTYQVNVRVIPKGIMPTGGGATTYYAPHLATLTIQVAYNPGFINTNLSSASDIGTDASRRLWVKTPGVTMINYSAQIARN
jgi:type II secretory pathway pseudopilin PulG